MYELDRAEREELLQLRQWKREAMTVLTEWEAVWNVAGRPGPLGGSKAQAVKRLIQQRRDGNEGAPLEVEQ